MLQVFQQINRPDLRPGYLNDLTIRDDTPLGSNEAWVRYLQTGEALLALMHMQVPAILGVLCWTGHQVNLVSDASRLHPIATGRPNLTATWNATFRANNFDVILYPGFALSIPPVDAAGELL